MTFSDLCYVNLQSTTKSTNADATVIITRVKVKLGYIIVTKFLET